MSYAKLFSVMGELASDVEAAQKKLALRIDQQLVFQTPVDEGRARANWIVSQESPEQTEKVAPANPNQGAQEALNQGRREIAKTAPFSLTYIQNNLPYIQRLNEGWSAQAPSKYIDRILAQALNE